MSSDRVVIVGLGLMGGSLLRALRERGVPTKIAGIDHGDVLGAARSFLDQGALPGSPESADLLAAADLVVLAMPGRLILEAIAPTLDALSPSGVVTDMASFKLSIAERAAAHPRANRFVPGHPMAGREIGGFSASRADLFEGASWFLVESGADEEAFLRVRGLVEAVGASPRTTSADAHDRAMALVSHAPHLVASALLELAAEAGALDFAGPGFHDTTRIAGGPDAIWADIFAENRGHLVAALDALVRRIDSVKAALHSGEREGVGAALALLASARRARNGRAGGGNG